MTKHTIIIIGATGLIGSHLVRLLSQDPSVSHIHCLVRRSVQSNNSQVSYHEIDFDQLETYQHLFDDATAVCCCIGTTIKKAKSKKKFEYVDRDIPITIGNIAYSKGINYYSLISSIGANPTANSFYLQVKGLVEKDLQNIGFKTLRIYRPSFLLGNRKEFRLIEFLMIPFFKGLKYVIPKKYRATDSLELAKMMQRHLNDPSDGTIITEANEFH